MPDENGRVSNRELYEVLTNLRNEMQEMERRLYRELARREDVLWNRDQIERLKARDWWGGSITAAVAVVVSTFFDSLRR